MITWDAYPPAPCQGQILGEDDQSILVQTDWDCPGIATTFGWDKTSIQSCVDCGHVTDDEDEREDHCPHCDSTYRNCDHTFTDGTVDCPDCGLTAGEFIGAAQDWLDDNDGATVEDPGYFE